MCLGRDGCRGFCLRCILLLNSKRRANQMETSALPSSSTSSSVNPELFKISLNLNSVFISGRRMCVYAAAASCTAVMSTSLVSSLLLYKHSKVHTSFLCCYVRCSLHSNLPLLLNIHQYSWRLLNKIGFQCTRV